MQSIIKEHLRKDNLHHAYLIEGIEQEVTPEILNFLEELGIETFRNPDVCRIATDSFKMEDALNLKSSGTEKGFSADKKIFIISVNSITLESQGALLKLFEEPIENTYFFLIVPDIHALLPTLVSRFYVISTKQNSKEEEKNAEKFIAMPFSTRINFIKELLTETEDTEEEEMKNVKTQSARSKSLMFLNAIEAVLYRTYFIEKNTKDRDINFFEHFFEVRQFLRQPGSAVKTLMESVALIIPLPVLKS